MSHENIEGPKQKNRKREKERNVLISNEINKLIFTKYKKC
jgi:hypothetical protein